MATQAHHGLPEHLSNGKLILQARSALNEIEGLMERRRNRDKACRTITDLFCLVEMLARRAGKAEGWEERGGRPKEDEDTHGREMWDEDGDPAQEAPEDPEREPAEGMSMAELFEWGVTDAEEEVAEKLDTTVRSLRAEHFGQMLRYLVRGCRQAEDVTAKVVALARRTIPGEMASFAKSQADVSRKIRPGGETRAAVQAREKQLVERPLKAVGARGYKLLGGVRSEGHREACREAQQGNRNRRRDKK